MTYNSKVDKTSHFFKNQNKRNLKHQMYKRSLASETHFIVLDSPSALYTMAVSFLTTKKGQKTYPAIKVLFIIQGNRWCSPGKMSLYSH